MAEAEPMRVPHKPPAGSNKGRWSDRASSHASCLTLSHPPATQPSPSWPVSRSVATIPAMEFHETDLPGVLLIEPKVWKDERGFFLETFHAQKWAGSGHEVTFVQDNHSKSLKGILRGLHCQLEQAQGKLVRCISGSIFDVAVDIRLGSPNFGNWYGVELSSENFRQLYVPPEFAHGFLVLSESAEVEYKCTDFYHPQSELSIRWDDPHIGIDWPIQDPTLSQKDRDAPGLNEVMDRLPLFHQEP